MYAVEAVNPITGEFTLEFDTADEARDCARLYPGASWYLA